MMRSSMYAGALSSSESDSESEHEEPVVRTERRHIRVQSDDEDEKRVVRSAKDKRGEEMATVVRNLNNHKKIKDMSNICKDFEDLVRIYEKLKKVTDDDGFTKCFIKQIADLEEFITESWETRKNLAKLTAAALTRLKQRVRKYNRDFEEQINDYKENPEAYKQEEEEAPQVAKSDDESESNEENSDSESEGVSDSESESDVESDDSWILSDSDSLDKAMEEFKDNPADFFLKKNVATKPEKINKKETSKKRQRAATAAILDGEHEGGEGEDGEEIAGWKMTDGTGRSVQALAKDALEQVQAFEKDVDITPDLVSKKLIEVMTQRGKKGTSISDQLILLSQIEDKIVELNYSCALHVKTIFNFITVLFDYEGKHPAFMPIPKFEKAIEAFGKIFDLFEQNLENITLNIDTNLEEVLLEAPYRVQASILASVGHLDDEYRKILQNANGHEIEYVERLRDERHICDLLSRLVKYVEDKKCDQETMCAAYLRKIDHLYYKFDYAWASKVDSVGLENAGQPEATEEMERLCRHIYSHDKSARLRTRAILCHIYFLALYNHWYRARDLMLMSNLQTNIEHADQATMILYNRALMQLGLCAFREGHIREAHSALVDSMNSMRLRELLAQGLPMQQQQRMDRTPEEERRERAMLMPYHMHINTDQLECVYMVSAMLLEIPMLAAHEMDLRWRPISKVFHMALRIHDRAPLVGPPETARDHVIAAAKAMRVGNWKACVNFVINEKMDAKIWYLFFQSKKVKAQLVTKIKEESLRSYLFTYSSVHDCLSLDRLAELFELPKPSVYSIICKMIINQELAASLEVPTDFLTMHKTERSRLQTLALQLSEKVNGIVEMNEKLIESRSSNFSSNPKVGWLNNSRRQNPRFTKI